MTRLLAIAAVAATAGLSAPAAAQEQAGDKVNTVIVYGNDTCPKSTGNEITVCARMSESERYRIPENLRGSDSPQNESWSNRVQSFETVGNFGPLSCSPYGAGGELGCTAKMIKDAYAEKKQGSDVKFGQLIAKARADRLSTIDQEAAATQSRVEDEEKAYEARQGRAQDAATPLAHDQAVVQPTRTVDPSRLATPPKDLTSPPKD